MVEESLASMSALGLLLYFSVATQKGLASTIRVRSRNHRTQLQNSGIKHNRLSRVAAVVALGGPSGPAPWSAETHSPRGWRDPLNEQIAGSPEDPGIPTLNTLSEVAAVRGPAVTMGSFLAGTHRELSVALIKCQGSVYRGCANLLAGAAGRQVSPGAEVPYEN